MDNLVFVQLDEPQSRALVPGWEVQRLLYLALRVRLSPSAKVCALFFVYGHIFLLFF
jgi:hypothetical protein